MSEKRTHAFLMSGMALLHPRTCGSSIRWTVDVHKSYRRLNRDVIVSLTDCDRGIKWSGYGNTGLQDMREKIEAAMTEFQNVLQAIAVAEAHCAKIPTRKKT